MSKRRVATFLWLIVGVGLAFWLGCRAYLSWEVAASKELLHAGDAERASLLLERPWRLARWLNPVAGAEIAFLRGVANRRSGKLDAALECFTLADNYGWSKLDLRREKLLVLFQSGRIDQAGPQLESLLADTLDNDAAEEIYDCLVHGYLAEYRIAGARVCLEYWLDWRPNAVKPRMLRAELFSFLEDHKRAAEEYETVLRLAPDEYDAHLLRAEALLKLRGVEDALAEYRWCAARRPHEGVARLGVAICQRQMGQIDEARHSLALASDYCRLDTKQEALLLAERGQIALLEQGKEQEAVADLTRAVELSPISPAYRYALGSALLRVGQRESAEHHMRKWKELQEHTERLADLEHAILTNPRDADLRYEIGLLLSKQGYEKESFAWWSSALRYAPNHRRTHEAMAEYFDRAKQSELAEKHRSIAAAGSG